MLRFYREEKIRAAFQLYDINGDGFIEMHEAIKFLTSVFNVVYGADPQLQDTMQVSPEELARITAEQCFEVFHFDLSYPPK